MTHKNIWYLPGPFHRYEDDVKAIAKKNGLFIIDANVTEDRTGETENPPEVTLKKLPVVVLASGPGVSSLDIETLRSDLEAVGVLVVGLEGGELQRPESGDLASRLFDALSGFHSSMVELTEKRDELASDNEKLRGEIAAFQEAADKLAADGTEIDEMKAKLDAASVNYRANASKESLEKLVAELPPA